MSSFQRLPSREKKISEIGAGDTRVSIVGTVVGASGNSFTVDDGSGVMNIIFEEPQNISQGGMVRVFGKIAGGEGEPEMHGDAWHEFPAEDLAMWRESSRLWEQSLKQL
jgi:hypothetical protein